MARRKAKAAFVLAGLLIGIATVVGLISLAEAMSRDINHKLEKYGANILVVPRTENLSLTYGGLSLGGVSFEMEEIQQEALGNIRTIENAANIAAIGPLVLGVVTVGQRKSLLAGIDFDATEMLKPWWKINGELPGENSVLLGAEAARIMERNVGDRLTMKDRPFVVSGILQSTGSQDDQLVFGKLETVQNLLGKEGRVSMVEISALCQDCPIDAMVKQVSDVLPGAKVMAIQQVVKGRMETLAQFRRFSYGVSAVVVLVGSLVVLVTMMGSVRERTAEIGIFRAIGFRRSHVMQIILLEAAVISALAGILGYLAGFGATKGMLRLFASNGAVFVPFNLELAGWALGIALGVGLMSSIYPALIAARLDPNEALRAI
jgi:putative ABC transport system permease protein